MLAAIIIAASFLGLAAPIIRIITPRPERLSRRQRRIIRYYHAN